MARYGLFGGTFDPPHLAHVRIAAAAFDHLSLDQLVIVPCHVPPLKRPARATPEQRLAMCRLAFDRPGFVVDPIELSRPGPSYTADTLAALAASRPGDWWLILGSDALADFPRWRSPEAILALARLAVVERLGDDLAELVAHLPNSVRSRLEVVPSRATGLASTAVREAAAEQRSVAEQVPESVAAFIAKHRLYTGA